MGSGTGPGGVSLAHGTGLAVGARTGQECVSASRLSTYCFHSASPRPLDAILRAQPAAVLSTTGFFGLREVPGAGPSCLQSKPVLLRFAAVYNRTASERALSRMDGGFCCRLLLSTRLPHVRSSPAGSLTLTHHPAETKEVEVAKWSRERANSVRDKPNRQPGRRVSPAS